jgi:hypothetical protein
MPAAVHRSFVASSVSLLSAWNEEEDQSSRRAEYQEVIIDLYLMMEASLDQLPATERGIRKRIMVHLLKATSVDEAHLSKLSLDDVEKVADHVRTFQEMDTPIDWDTIRDMVLLTLLDEPD